MKSSTIAELEPLRYIVLDMCEADQGLHVQLSGFYTQVLNRCRTRGWKELLLIDLPTLGKLVDKGLSTGTFPFEEVPQAFGKLDSYSKIINSWIFQDLLSILFYDNGVLDHNVDVNHVLFVRQLCYLYKKYDIDCTSERISDEVSEFFNLDKSLRRPSGTWDNDQYIPHRFSFGDDQEVGNLPSELRSVLYVLDIVCSRCVPRREVDVFSLRPRHGPGAVADAKRRSDKYLFNSWPLKLEATFPFDYFCNPNEELASANLHQPSSLESPAKLIAVPKTYKGPRLIASEPTAHQFLQQALMVWIREQVFSSPLRNCISFQDQGPSQDAALSGSITGDLSTVDLSSASDRLSCWTVERAFGSNQSLLNCLHAARTRVVVDNTGSSSCAIKLKKFAAQGSAVTFPVQTIIYACCCIAAHLYTNSLEPNKKNIIDASRKVRVFGDDICLPSPSVPILADLLHYLELKVNESKTHTNGYFRESCGKDAYRGHDVTPIYTSSHRPGTSPESISSWIEVSNNFHLQGYWNLSSWMTNSLDQAMVRKLIISRHQGPGIRLRTFSEGAVVRRAKRRFSVHLHREEALSFTLVSETRMRSRGSWNDLLDYFLQAPAPDSNWVHGYVTKSAARFRVAWVPL